MNQVTINEYLRSATNIHSSTGFAQSEATTQNLDIKDNSDQVIMESDPRSALLKVGLLLFFATLACFGVLQLPF